MSNQPENSPRSLEPTLDSLVGLRPGAKSTVDIEYLGRLLGENTSTAYQRTANTWAALEDELSTVLGEPVRSTIPHEPVRRDAPVAAEASAPTVILPAFTEAATVRLEAKEHVPTPTFDRNLADQRRQESLNRRRRRVEDRLRALLAERDEVRGLLAAAQPDGAVADGAAALKDKLADLVFQIVSLAHTRDHLRGVAGDRVAVVRETRVIFAGTAPGAPNAQATTALSRRLQGIACSTSISSELADLARLRTRLLAAVRHDAKDPRLGKLVRRLRLVEAQISAILERLRAREHTVREILETVGKTADEEIVRRNLIEKEGLVPKAEVPPEVRIRLEVLEQARDRWLAEREELNARLADATYQTERHHQETTTRRVREEVLGVRIAEAETEIRRVRETLARSEEETRTLRVERDCSATAVSEAEAKAAAKTAELNRRAAELESALETARTEHEQECRLLQDEIARGESELSEVVAAEERLAQEVDETRQRLAAGAEVTTWLGRELNKRERITARVADGARRWKRETRRLTELAHQSGRRLNRLSLDRDAAARREAEAVRCVAAIQVDLGQASARAIDAEDRVQALTHKFSEATAAHEALHQTLEARIQDQGQALDALTEDKAGAILEREQARAALRGTQDELHGSQDELRSAQEDLVQTRAHAESLAADLEAAWHEAEGFRRKLEEAERAQQDAEEKIAEFSRRLAGTEQSLGTAWEKLVGAQQAAADRLAAEKQDSDRRVAEVREQAEARVAEVKEQAEARVAALNAELGAELDRARNETHGARVDADAVRSELEDLHGLGDILNAQKAELEQRIAELGAVRDALQAEVETTRAERDSTCAERDGAFATRDEAFAARDGAFARQQELAETMEQLEHDLSDAIEHVDQLEEALETERARAEQAHLETAAAREETEVERQRAARAEQDRADQVVEFERVRAELEEARAGLSEAQAGAEQARATPAPAAPATPGQAARNKDLAVEIVRRHPQVFRTLVSGDGISPLTLEPVVADLVASLRRDGYWTTPLPEGLGAAARKALHLARVACLSLHMGLSAGRSDQDLRGLGTCALLHEADGLRWFLKAHGHDYARILRIAEAFETLTTRASLDRENPHKAVESIVRHTSKGAFDKSFVRVFLEAVSRYPIGSWVRLNTGQQAQVVRANGREVLRPVVEVREPDGTTNRIDLLADTRFQIEEAVAQ